MPSSLTPAQLTTFKTAINGDTALAADREDGNHGKIVDYYNTGTATLVWRPSVTIRELNTAIVWSEFIALGQGARDAYRAMIAGGLIDPTSLNVRNGFNFIFSGTSQTNLIALCRRNGSRFEVLPGWISIASQGAVVSSVFGRSATVDDVVAALAS